ncbi:hypothetical protein [Anabaena sp. UHCC 0399]|nr:hypothetical protein [Anabaena sp. UHCC 0399]MEA5569352.1 hypothetical protein [Anabaena sp. UHCC 0399]
MAEVRFTPPFKRRLKTLTKRYRQIQIDIQPIIDQLQADVSLEEIEDAI